MLELKIRSMSETQLSLPCEDSALLSGGISSIS